jgi:hypothetical protein
VALQPGVIYHRYQARISRFAQKATSQAAIELESRSVFRLMLLLTFCLKPGFRPASLRPDQRTDSCP